MKYPGYECMEREGARNEGRVEGKKYSKASEYGELREGRGKGSAGRKPGKWPVCGWALVFLGKSNLDPQRSRIYRVILVVQGHWTSERGQENGRKHGETSTRRETGRQAKKQAKRQAVLALYCTLSYLI